MLRNISKTSNLIISQFEIVNRLKKYFLMSLYKMSEQTGNIINNQQLKRGRPPKYKTEEERSEAFRQQMREACRKYYAKMRVMREEYQINRLLNRVVREALNV